MEKIESLKNQKWVIGVSGGCDSMALLHMCINANVKVVIAHVNYKKRDSADRDMEGVKAFAAKYQIPIFVLEVNEYKDKENFQKQAREIRYHFYEKCIRENNCLGVLVAHHKDDVLETYLMQKKSNRIVDYYGIKEDVTLYNILVKRVLLDYTKEQLQEYCIKNNVPYYEDESNFEDGYERNRIRHKIVEKMENASKDKLMEEIHKENEILQIRVHKAEQFISENTESIAVEKFLNIEKEVQPLCLRLFILKHTTLDAISKKAIMDMICWIESHKKTNQYHTINAAYDLAIEYGTLFVKEKKESKGFKYVLDHIEYLKTPYFTISKEGKVIEGLCVSESDFPITIRNAKSSDTIKLRIGTKRVGRFFIDRKIPHEQREIWPVVENKDGNVIFVSGIGCDINHYGNISSFFVLK